MTEKEQIEGQIKILQKKLNFLEELEKTKSPVEEAFKDNYGVYPNELKTTDDFNCWKSFKRGYVAAQKDYKVGEYQEPEEEPEEPMEKLGFVKNSDGNWTAQPLVETAQEPEKLKTLYQMLNDEEFRDDVCYVVKEWMSQYTHNVMSGEYLEGYNGCLDVLEENLK